MIEFWQTPSDEVYIAQVFDDEEYEVWLAPLARNNDALKDAQYLEGNEFPPPSLDMDYPGEVATESGEPFARLIATYKVNIHPMRDRNGEPYAFGNGLEYLGPIEPPNITAAEFRCIRDRVGVSMGWLAAYFDVQERTIHRWEAGTSMIPSGVKVEILGLNKRFRRRYISGKDANGMSDARFDAMVNFVRKSVVDNVVHTYRTDEDLLAMNPDAMFSAQNHRAACAQLMWYDPKIKVLYYGDENGKSPITQANRIPAKKH